MHEYVLRSPLRGRPGKYSIKSNFCDLSLAFGLETKGPPTLRSIYTNSDFALLGVAQHRTPKLEAVLSVVGRHLRHEMADSVNTPLAMPGCVLSVLSYT
jgi:hypothetical protein